VTTVKVTRGGSAFFITTITDEDTTMRNRNPWHLLLMLLGLLGSAPMLPAHAAGVVTDCSTFGATGTPGVYLEDTLGAALAGGGDVTFACSGTIIVPEIILEIDTTIDATGQTVTLSGNQANPVLQINGNVKVDLINLAITQGWTYMYGIITNLGGTVSLSNCTLSSNRSYGYGVIYNNNEGILNITKSTLSSNSATYGAGIKNYGILTISESILSGNSASFGGGIDNYGPLTISNSILSGNSAEYGGGIYNNHNSPLATIADSTL
jgi:hypothetical protein